MNKRKVMFFIDSLNSGGAQRQITMLAVNIDRNRFDPFVVIYHDLRHFQQKLDDAGVPVIYLPKSYYIDINFFFALLKLIRKHKPDFIISYLKTPNMWARLAVCFTIFARPVQYSNVKEKTSTEGRVSN